jgi:hypothetical protein
MIYKKFPPVNNQNCEKKRRKSVCEIFYKQRNILYNNKEVSGNLDVPIAGRRSCRHRWPALILNRTD